MLLESAQMNAKNETIDKESEVLRALINSNEVLCSENMNQIDPLTKENDTLIEMKNKLTEDIKVRLKCFPILNRQ